jgi:hypothetical protein
MPSSRVHIGSSNRERIPETSPFSLTLLCPWVPAAQVTDADLERLRAFFASRPALEFDLTHVAEFAGVVAYAVPELDDELRATMRALWALYPQCPAVRPAGFRSSSARDANALREPDECIVRAGKEARRATPSRALRRQGGDAPRGVRARSRARTRDVSLRSDPV